MDTVVVFTKKDLETMIEQGGSGYWKADENRLKKCTYLVATANSHAVDSKHTAEKHGQAFLIGKICGVVDAPSELGRKVLQLREYALIDIPNSWGGQRNPVRYTNLSEFNLSPNNIKWRAFPTDGIKVKDITQELTIEEAKRGLAKKFGVNLDSIEIIIRA